MALTARSTLCSLCPALCASRHCIVEPTIYLPFPLAAGSVPQIMAVGEAPGETEDLVGEPFVGKAGQKLRAAFREIEMPAVVLTNAVRCRPERNRDPKKEEVANCAPWLALDLERWRPSVVLILGRVAAKAFAAGNFNLPWPHVVVETVHPSAVLRRPAYHERFMVGLIEARDALKGYV